MVILLTNNGEGPCYNPVIVLKLLSSLITASLVSVGGYGVKSAHRYPSALFTNRTNKGSIATPRLENQLSSSKCRRDNIIVSDRRREATSPV